MLFEKLPTLEIRNERTIGILFSVLNSFFALRLSRILIASDTYQSTIRLMVAILSVQVLFVIAGLITPFFRKILGLLNITGAPLGLYLTFILVKRFLKPIINEISTQLQIEIGAWFYGVFLFLALIITINFFRDLTNRALGSLSRSNTHQAASNLLKYGYWIISFLLLGYWIYTQFVLPLPVFSNYDPEYPYLLNSLTPFKDFELYGRMDHPGTYLQIIGSFIAIILSPLSAIQDGFPFEYHIHHPQAFLYTARFIILLLNLFTLRLLYKYFQSPASWSETFTGLSAFIIYFATFTDSIEFLTNWSPNSFNFSVGAYVLVLFFMIVINGKYKDKRTLWMISLAAGLAATFHVYMLSLILVVTTTVVLTNLFEGNQISFAIKHGLTSIIGAGAGYLTGTMVILRHYESFMRWVINILTHQGNYGAGSSGFITFQKLLQNFHLLWKFNSTIFILLLLSVLILTIIFIIHKKQNSLNARLWAFVCAIYLQIIVLLILIGKHPGDRYLLSIAGSLPVIVILISNLLTDLPHLKTPLSITIFAGLFILFISTAHQSILEHNQKSAYFLDYQNEIESFKNTQISQSRYDPTEIQYYWTYNTWSPCYALWLGNDFSKKRFTDEILEICPQDLQYDIWNATFNDLSKLKDTRTQNIVIMNKRNFNSVDEAEYITKIESSVQNLGFIVVH